MYQTKLVNLKHTHPIPWNRNKTDFIATGDVDEQCECISAANRVACAMENVDRNIFNSSHSTHTRTHRLSLWSIWIYFMGQFKIFFAKRKDTGVGTGYVSSGTPFCCAWSNLARFREALYQVVCVVQTTTFASEFPNTIMTRRRAIRSELETSNIYQ